MTPEQQAARALKDRQIRDRFDYKTPTEVHWAWYEIIARDIDRLVGDILQIPDGQERAVALTQLGLARMCINAAIANTPKDAFREYNS